MLQGAEGLDRAQIAARAHLFGDDPSIPRVALRLAASSALAGPIDGQPRHVHDALARIEQHGGHQTSDPADDIDSHSAFAAQGHTAIDRRAQSAVGVA